MVAKWNVDLYHGAVGAPAAATSVLFASGAVAHVAGMPPETALTLAGAGTLGAVGAGALQGVSRPVLGYTGAVGAAAGGWLAYAAANGAYTWDAAAGLGAAAGVLGALYPVARAAVRRRRGVAPASAPRPGRGGQWADILTRADCAEVRILGQTARPMGSYALQVQLPDSGRVTLAGLHSRLDRIATAADLPAGWLLGVEAGATTREALITCTSPDAIRQEHPYPADLSALSVNDPFPFGLYSSGETAHLLMRQVSLLIAGTRGSGKSNLLSVLLAQLARSTDVIIWYLDVGKSGKAARPWIHDWLQGQPGRPVLDWVATTPQEAARMLRAANNLIDFRTRNMLDGIGTENLTPTPRQPAVVVVGDEIADLFGQQDPMTAKAQRAETGISNRQLLESGTSLIRRGRSEAVDLVAAVQRVTNSMLGGGDLRTLFNHRMGLWSPSASDLGWVFPGDRVPAKALPKHSMYYKDGEDTDPRIAKAYRLEYDRIPEIARACMAWRPELEPGAEDALGEDYTGRWHPARAVHLSSGQRPVAITGPAPVSAPVPVGADQAAGADGSSLVARAAAVLGGSVKQPQTGDASRPIPPILEQTAAVFETRNAERLHTAALLDAIGIPTLTAKRLGQILTACGIEPGRTVFEDDHGRRARGYLAADVTTAVAAIRSGDQTPSLPAWWRPETAG